MTIGARCPNCGEGMTVQATTGGNARPEIDICYGCHAFWFDAMESPALSEAAVLELFKRIHEHRNRQRRPLGNRLGCPRCSARLVHTRDVQRTNRIEYERCPQGHGRFTTFFQFLREKNFVRSLSPPELKQLRAQVSQVRCSSCGATVSLEKAACAHCGAPVSILDADAVEKTVLTLNAKAAARAAPVAADAMPDTPRSSAESLQALRGRTRSPWLSEPREGLRDLFVEAIDEVCDWLSD